MESTEKSPLMTSDAPDKNTTACRVQLSSGNKFIPSMEIYQQLKDSVAESERIFGNIESKYANYHAEVHYSGVKDDLYQENLEDQRLWAMKKWNDRTRKFEAYSTLCEVYGLFEEEKKVITATFNGKPIEVTVKHLGDVDCSISSKDEVYVGYGHDKAGLDYRLEFPVDDKQRGVFDSDQTRAYRDFCDKPCDCKLCTTPDERKLKQEKKPHKKSLRILGLLVSLIPMKRHISGVVRW